MPALVVTTTQTINDDQFVTDDDAVRYNADNIQVTIGAGTSVVSTDDDGVESTRNGSTLINNGNIFGVVEGASFLGDNAVITNNAGRSIAGRLVGVAVNGDDVTVINHGTIIGHTNTGIFLGISSDNVVLNNDGVIYGQDFGVLAQSLFDGGVINNSGLIHSDNLGVIVSTAPGLTTAITNFADGTIKGPDAAIVTSPASDGRISLDNRGTIAGIIDLNADTGNVNDVIVNKGKITGDAFLGPGSDVFNGTASKGAVKVFGEAGNDTLTGGNSADQLNGGANNDALRGGLGRDILTGGSERDFFDFNSLAEAGKAAGRDIITDFNRAVDDRIDLSTIDARTGVAGNQAFKFIGTQAFHDVKGELRASGGIIQGDINGDAVADFEIKVNLATLVGGDFFL